MLKRKNCSLKIKLSSQSKENLLKQSFLLKNQLSKLFIPFTSINMPKSKVKLTLLRSPHVYKKSKEHFALQCNSVVFYVSCEFNTLKFVGFNSLPDVLVSITKVR